MVSLKCINIQQDGNKHVKVTFKQQLYVPSPELSDWFLNEKLDSNKSKTMVFRKTFGKAIEEEATKYS